MKKRLLLLSIIICLPLLVSLDPIIYDSTYYANYKSPEGIQFISYTDEWNEKKLQKLYEELIQNKHGEEIKFLQEVKVVGEGLGDYPSEDYDTKGQYHALTNTITLYHGDKYTEPEMYRETLAHEYGHHFTYYYFPSHHFPFSKWSKLRGLDVASIRWDAFVNYSTNQYGSYPQEIIADDYVLLYGSTRKVEVKDVLTNEAFYTMIQHDNQQLTNVLELSKLHSYFEEKTGLTIDKRRLLATPTLKGINNNTLSFSVINRANVAFRLNVKMYNDDKLLTEETITAITTNDSDGEVTFTLRDLDFADTIEGSISVLDLNTSIGFEVTLGPLYVNSKK
ncbi:hypothetical protein PY093_02635 [Cytobacillus sp. S13-E01]|uniref:hypothetical protein n=1 Tax=Cytobacillus sp. S13-E01 TaxID=3031326 RepID=UPI0023D83E8E|nr:hypothetical protein [Cytobacillus sp. S13-E01]MDF0725610.1 hypothetical protein [Cytobacillus sp. S13-E01]